MSAPGDVANIVWSDARIRYLTQKGMYSMTLQELLPELRKLDVTDKIEVIKLLTEEVAKQSAVFIDGAVYEVWSPYDSGEAAVQLQKMLDDYRKAHNG